MKKYRQIIQTNQNTYLSIYEYVFLCVPFVTHYRRGHIAQQIPLAQDTRVIFIIACGSSAQCMVSTKMAVQCPTALVCEWMWPMVHTTQAGW